MLRAAIAFFVIGLAAMALGAGGFAGMSVEIGRMLLGIFVLLAIISFVVSLVTGKGGRSIT
ncbi:MAG: DUF1328 domain-containing protein [Cryobacterium sp.]|nr:DUF1328 domain-containing protein [Oligoflexia bacterium]